MARSTALAAVALVLLAACTGGHHTASKTTAPSGATPEPRVSGVGYDPTHVTLHLTRTAKGPQTVSFGLPVPPGVRTDPATVQVTAQGKTLDATVRTLLTAHDASAAPQGVRSIQVQFPASAMTADEMNVDVAWTGGKAQHNDPVAFDQTSVESVEKVHTAQRTVENKGGAATLTVTKEADTTLFTGREPAVMVEYPAGYLAATGILGRQVLDTDPAAAKLKGLDFITEEITPFGLSAIYRDKYPVNPDAVIVPNAQENYEAWLYDRCATFLSFYVHTNDSRFLRESYRECSYYARRITLDGDNRGIFSGKADPDPKYSHLRGLYAYFALTGDDAAKTAGVAIADLWKNDQGFVGSYRDGHIRATDSLWTERLLGVSMEGLLFGYLLTDQADYLDTFAKVLDTAYLHITGDAAALAKINPGTPAFPPQNCFIHTAEQHSEGNADEPWCSGWMNELLLPALLEYQSMTADKRVDEIFVRLTRFLRDVGTSYFKGDRIDDTFLHPRVRYDTADDPDNRRELTPLYGAGIGLDGKRANAGEYDDTQHCLDGTALVAAGLAGLRRQGGYDKNPVGPFTSEGASFLAMENELLACARQEFVNQTRVKRDPGAWTADKLKDGLADPAKFIADNKIGYPSYNNSPERRLSWWFNSGLLDYGLLADAQVDVNTLTPGAVQPG